MAHVAPPARRAAPRARAAYVVCGVVLAASTLLGAPRPVEGQSQTTSAIRGSVVRENGSGIADALVTVRHTLTGTERSVLTDDEGLFVLLLIQPGGPYTVTARLVGFSEGREEDISLQVGETRTVTLVLLEQALEIEGLAARIERNELFNAAQMGPATLINQRTIQSTPLASRDIMDLTVLSPLVRTTEGGGFSVAGQNDRYNSILVDGMLNNDAFGLTASGVPGGQAGAKLLPIDAVAQYEILVAPFDAGLSGFAGGVMNAVTRTGTNEFDLRASAVIRNEALMGDLTLPSGSADASGIQRTLLGLSVGGPVVRDRAHYFVSAELETRSQFPTGYNLGREPAPLVGIVPELMEDFQDFFRDTHGLEPGHADPYTLDQTLANLFARADWSLSERHRLTVRNVLAYASDDESPNRAPFEPYGLSSNAVFLTSFSNTASVQFFSDLGDRGGNEIALTVHRSTDRSEPAVPWPQVEAVLTSPAQGITTTRPVRVGSQFFAQQNDLAQTSVRLANTLTLVRGRHTWTAGLLGTWYDIEHTYLPGATGDWYFASWDDVLNNAPSRHQRAILLEGQDATVRFNVAELGAFLQNEMDLGRGFTLRAGLRFDSPVLLDKPEENVRIESFFLRSTADVPSGMFLFSPRLGLNWQGGERLRTQVRAGAGLFTGQLPHVWLSNAFQNTGLRFVTQTCSGRRTDDPLTGNTAPPFDGGEAPLNCLAGQPNEVRAVTLFEDGFQYPQYAKFSAAVDQEITSRISASAGLIFTHAINQVLLREVNILPQTEGLLPLAGYGGTARMHFGVPTNSGFLPIRPLPGYDQVLLATNGNGDRSWSVNAEIRGDITDRLAFHAGYAYVRSYDRMSLTSVDLVANYGSTPTHGDPNDPPLTPSNFDRPHKVMLSLFGTPIPRLARTEVALLYTGESGLPFSYVYRGDMNGDGYPFAGPAFDRNNDLFFVPLEATNVPSSIATYVRLAAALETDACLDEFRGTFVTRNGCRAPWQNRLDLRLAHTATVRGLDVRFSADVINLLNLVNTDWGLVRTIPPISSLLGPVERIPITGELLSEWVAGLLPFRDGSGNLVTPEPWSIASPQSQWQAQFGLRVTLGR